MNLYPQSAKEENKISGGFKKMDYLSDIGKCIVGATKDVYNAGVDAGIIDGDRIGSNRRKSLMFDDPNQHPEDVNLPNEIKHFKMLLAKDQMPSINFTEIEELAQKAKLNAIEEKLTPNPANGDEDDELDDIYATGNFLGSGDGTCDCSI